MGPASREARFLVPKPRLTEADVRQLGAVDHVDHEALVALAVEDCRPVGIARFVRDSADRETAEVAVDGGRPLAVAGCRDDAHRGPARPGARARLSAGSR